MVTDLRLDRDVPIASIATIVRRLAIRKNGTRVPLDQKSLNAYFLSGECRAQTSGARTDNQTGRRRYLPRGGPIMFPPS